MPKFIDAVAVDDESNVYQFHLSIGDCPKAVGGCPVVLECEMPTGRRVCQSFFGPCESCEVKEKAL